jgi:hypothetical protein
MENSGWGGEEEEMVGVHGGGVQELGVHTGMHASGGRGGEGVVVVLGWPATPQIFIFSKLQESGLFGNKNGWEVLGSNPLPNF